MWWSCWSVGSSRIICSFSSWWSQSEWKRSCLAWFSEWHHQHFGNLSYIAQILSVHYFSFSVLVLREANKSPTHRILVGNQREKTTLGHDFLSFFFFHSVIILYMLRYCLVQGPLCTFLFEVLLLLLNFVQFFLFTNYSEFVAINSCMRSAWLIVSALNLRSCLMIVYE